MFWLFFFVLIYTARRHYKNDMRVWDEVLMVVMVAVVAASPLFVTVFAFWAEGMCSKSGMCIALRVERSTD
jgi:membrane-bound acyltransferase YfiQ involved in biofilm formation